MSTLFRVKWTRIEKKEGFVVEDDQDQDVWEGTEEQAKKLARRMRKLGRDGAKFTVVPARQS